MEEMVVEAFLGSLFNVVFEKLASSSFIDYFRRVKLDTLVDKLESILNSINQVLDDAEKKQYENPDVKIWLGDVKHAMYEADQLLDEIATDAPLKKLKAESQPSTSNIFSFIPTFTNPFESRIKELIKSLDSLAEQKDMLDLKKGTCARNGVGVSLNPSDRSQTTSLVHESHIYGRDGYKEDIINYLLADNDSGNQVSVTSIVGLGGMGKTTLAQLVYNDPKIQERFELKAWVYVSEHFDVIGLTKSILSKFHAPAISDDLDLLQRELQKILTGKKYLLVVDDVWDKNEEGWEHLLLPFNHGSSGSKIIVTTCDKEVASVLKSTKLFDLQQLEKNDCWSLFVAHAFHGKCVCDYVMHDLVNDLTKSVSGEFCMQIEGASLEGSLERTRHIWFSLQSNCVDKLLEPTCDLQGLRSLILEGNTTMLISNSVQHDLFSRLKCLRMLSFRYCGLSKLIDEISDLKLLRYLDISYTEITSLPDTICMLYNLQTLLLEDCQKLTELPSNFSKLVNLRHLELSCIEKMPKHMGKLNNLQTLSYFIVEDPNGSDLKELAKLNHLRGTIYILGLGNVSDLADAATVNMKDKKYLEELYMIFDGEREEMDDSIVESNASVLKALQPNSNLNRLTIAQYKGNSFPNWISGCNLPNLVYLELKGCGLCFYLPPLGQLPCLKELSIRDCDGIKITGEEFHGNNSTNVPFRSLEVLKFEDMYSWEEWFCLEGFPLLKELYISHCPKLKRVSLPQHLPSLQKLFINDCNKLEASIPKGDNIIWLDLRRCESILINELPTSLKNFVLRENRYTEFSVEQILVNNTILEMLELELSGCVKYPSLNLCCYNSLWTLSIKGLRSSSLSFSLHLFTNLCSLCLYDCSELDSFPEGGLPSNLRWLTIWNCPKLIGSREEWGLFQLNSLKQFKISDEFENVESFPEENLLPPTLEYLYLKNCSKLRKMNNKGFLHLKSLDALSIENCPSLECLPEKEALLCGFKIVHY